MTRWSFSNKFQAISYEQSSDYIAQFSSHIGITLERSSLLASLMPWFSF